MVKVVFKIQKTFSTLLKNKHNRIKINLPKYNSFRRQFVNNIHLYQNVILSNGKVATQFPYTQDICITFVQRRLNVYVLCLLG